VNDTLCYNTLPKVQKSGSSNGIMSYTAQPA